jgi:peptidyl-tRNA hydrolase, PTH1 family
VWLIVGLGNPGTRYRFTRHNIGFLVLDALAAQQGISWKAHRLAAVLGSASVGGQEVTLVKPQSFMNNSGQVVAPLLRRRAVPLDCLLVVHDDLDLPFGKIKIKQGGGAGGHKGIASIQREVGDQAFARVKLGIGRPIGPESPEEYVLSPFPASEGEQLPGLLERACEAVLSVLDEGVERAMNRFNRREDAACGESPRDGD